MKGGDQKHNSTLTKIKKGDQKAFEDLYYQYCDQLSAFAYRYLKDPALVEDALQEIFYKIWSGRKKLDPNQSIQGLLFTSLKNHILNTIRSRKNEMAKHVEKARKTESQSNETMNTVEFEEYRRQVSDWVCQLPPRKQEILVMSIFDGYSNEEIAQKLGISENTVRFQVSQSSKFLRNHIEEIQGTS